LFHWDGTGLCENSTTWKSCKRVQAQGGGANRNDTQYIQFL
jgi:hypothetical protein